MRQGTCHPCQKDDDDDDDDGDDDDGDDVLCSLAWLQLERLHHALLVKTAFKSKPCFM